MSSEGAVAAAGPRLHRLFPWFDTQSAAVVTILLGLFQILLCVPLAYVETNLPKLFVAPLIFGILVVAAGSITFANERNFSKLLTYSNSLKILLLLYSLGALVVQSILSVSAFKTLKTE
ncbi:hypothetical protein ABVT39_022072 [Epinephelus coioides]